MSAKIFKFYIMNAKIYIMNAKISKFDLRKLVI